MIQLTEVFPWNENFETGIPAIDVQHKKLVQLVNPLASHMAHQGDNPTAARLGGDQCVLPLGELQRPRDCVPLLSKLPDEAATTVTSDRKEMQVTASIGVALYPPDAENAERLMLLADAAMYQAKKSGKSRFHFHQRAQEQ